MANRVGKGNVVINGGRQLVRTSAGVLYAIHRLTGSSVNVFKSTNNGASWAQLDYANSPSAANGAIALAIDGNNNLYIVYGLLKGTNVLLQVATFSTVSDTFTNFTTASNEGAATGINNLDIAIDSNSNVHIAYTTGGGNNLMYINNVNKQAANWLPAVTIFSSIAVNSVAIAISQNNLPVITSRDTTNGVAIWIGNTNNARSFTGFVVASAANSTSNTGTSIAFDKNNFAWVAYQGGAGSNISLGKVTLSGNVFNVVPDSGKKGGNLSVAIYGTDIYVFYSGRDGGGIAFNKVDGINGTWLGEQIVQPYVPGILPNIPRVKYSTFFNNFGVGANNKDDNLVEYIFDNGNNDVYYDKLKNAQLSTGLVSFSIASGQTTTSTSSSTSSTSTSFSTSTSISTSSTSSSVSTSSTSASTSMSTSTTTLPATCVIDQSQPLDSSNLFFGDSGVKKVAQSFQPSITAKICNIQIKAGNAFLASDNLKVGIYSDSSGVPGSLIQDSDVSVAGTGLDWHAGVYTLDYTFSGGSVFNANTPYWTVLERSGALDDSGNEYYTRYDSGGAYTRGAPRYLNDVDVWTDFGDVNDIYFKEYYDTTSIVTTTSTSSSTSISTSSTSSSTSISTSHSTSSTSQSTSLSTSISTSSTSSSISTSTSLSTSSTSSSISTSSTSSSISTSSTSSSISTSTSLSTSSTSSSTSITQSFTTSTSSTSSSISTSTSVSTSSTSSSTSISTSSTSSSTSHSTSSTSSSISTSSTSSSTSLSTSSTSSSISMSSTSSSTSRSTSTSSTSSSISTSISTSSTSNSTSISTSSTSSSASTSTSTTTAPLTTTSTSSTSSSISTSSTSSSTSTTLIDHNMIPRMVIHPDQYSPNAIVSAKMRLKQINPVIKDANAKPLGLQTKSGGNAPRMRIPRNR